MTEYDRKGRLLDGRRPTLQSPRSLSNDGETARKGRTHPQKNVEALTNVSKVNLLVVVDDAHVGEISKVADALAQKGLQIEQTSEISGTIVGQIEEEKADVLKSIEGVQQVREEATYQLPPLDEESPQ